MSLGLAFRATVAFLVLATVGLGWAITQSAPASQHVAPVQVLSAPAAVASTATAPALPSTRPHVVEPTAGEGAAATSTAPVSDAAIGVDNGPASSTLAMPVSLAVIRQELAESGLTADTSQATLTTRGLALAPLGAPLAVQQIIAAGNEIARLPYVWGGGHATFVDTGYDCSGSLSYVFAAAHLLSAPMVSGQFAQWGDPGPGRWVTIFANAGHTFMYVAGLRFDTVALAETGTRWSNRAADEPDLSTFSVRHPPGL